MLTFPVFSFSAERLRLWEREVYPDPFLAKEIVWLGHWFFYAFGATLIPFSELQPGNSEMQAHLSVICQSPGKSSESTDSQLVQLVTPDELLFLTLSLYGTLSSSNTLVKANSLLLHTTKTKQNSVSLCCQEFLFLPPEDSFIRFVFDSSQLYFD